MWLMTTGEQSQIVERPSSARAAEINADNDRNIDENHRDHPPLHHPYIMYDLFPEIMWHINLKFLNFPPTITEMHLPIA
jgi:hypothetical protein